MAARVGKYLLFETLGEGAFGKYVPTLPLLTALSFYGVGWCFCGKDVVRGGFMRRTIGYVSWLVMLRGCLRGWCRVGAC